MNVVISGASKGLGKAIAEQFASHGYDLYICASNAAVLEQSAEALRLQFPKVTIMAKAFDLGKKKEAKAFGQWIIGLGGAVDILVNNAGIFFPGNIYDEKEGTLELMMNINVYSAYHLTRTLLPGMIAKKSGHIFNICSIASLDAYPNGGSYGISKFALAGFSKNLRHELQPHGIKVTGVYPGAVYTDSWAATGVDPERIMAPADVAQMIYAASRLSQQATVEDIILRPQLGDL